MISRILVGATALLVNGLIVRGMQRYPERKVAKAVAGMLQEAGGPNRFVHAPRPDATFRKIVKPSPDLLYSVLVFDVTQHALAVEIPPFDDYWVNQVVAMNTDSVAYIGSQNQPPGRPTRFVVFAPETPAFDTPEGYQEVASPRARGVFLLRFLIRSPERMAAIEAVRQNITVRMLQRAYAR